MTKRQTGVLALILLALGLASGAVWIINRTLRASENAYAGWYAASLVIDHMETHHGQWPRDWNDLQAAYQRKNSGDASEAMAHYQALVEVDFNADPRKLACVQYDDNQREPPFQVIRHRRQPHSYYTEPNRLIWLYLTGKLEGTSRSVTRPVTIPAK
jgi:hypothetical protein